MLFQVQEEIHACDGPGIEGSPMNLKKASMQCHMAENPSKPKDYTDLLNRHTKYPIRGSCVRDLTFVQITQFQWKCRGALPQITQSSRFFEDEYLYRALDSHFAPQ